MPISPTDVYSPPEVDRIEGIWGSDYNIPKAILYLLKGDYRFQDLGPLLGGPQNKGL